MDENSRNNSLTRIQKTGFVLLLIFGILAVGLGVLQLRNTIFGPFVINLSQLSNVPVGLFTNDEVRLQNIDTDHDGISDWDELNFYGTSPYLADTDSDGISDYDEIFIHKTDPLCAKGDVCEFKGVESSEAGGETPAMEFPTNNAGFGFLSEVAQGDIGGETAMELLGALTDPQQVRQMILQSGGISAEELSQIDDATLMQIVQELLAGQEPAS